MRILVLGDCIADLKAWARQFVAGHDVAFSQPRLRVLLDGVEFVLRTYDMTDTVAGMTFNTVLHVRPVPLEVRPFIRVPPKYPL